MKTCITYWTKNTSHILQKAKIFSCPGTTTRSLAKPGKLSTHFTKISAPADVVEEEEEEEEEEE